MAVGKSAVGRNLAKRLRRRFVDLDRMVEKIEGMKVRDIFEQKGEAHFRQVEKQSLAGVLQQDGQIIATGGGVEVFPSARTFVRVDVSDRLVRYPGPVFDSDFTVRDDSFFGHDFRFSIGAGLRF